MVTAMGFPAMQVAENAGVEGAVVLAKIQALANEKGVSQVFGGYVSFCELILRIPHFFCFVLPFCCSSDMDGMHLLWNTVT